MRASVLAAATLLVLCLACLAVSEAAAQLDFETDVSVGRELLQARPTANKPAPGPRRRHLLEEEDVFSVEGRELLSEKKPSEKKGVDDKKSKDKKKQGRHLLSDEVEFAGRELLSTKPTDKATDKTKAQSGKKKGTGRRMLGCGNFPCFDSPQKSSRNSGSNASSKP